MCVIMYCACAIDALVMEGAHSDDVGSVSHGSVEVTKQSYQIALRNACEYIVEFIQKSLTVVKIVG